MSVPWALRNCLPTGHVTLLGCACSRPARVLLAGARISDEELQTTMMIWHEADSESSARGVADGVCLPPACPLSHHGTCGD
eukprot:COSAG01_NODE_89_length_27311_cov_22.687061_2_plen_81_part_00